MSLSFGFYSDRALTTRISTRLFFAQAASAPSAAIKPVWFGSPIAGRSIQAASAPGVDAIRLSIVSSGSGSPVGDVRLATSEAAMSSATPGADLLLGSTLASGIDNARAVYISLLDSTASPGLHSNLSITTNTLQES